MSLTKVSYSMISGAYENVLDYGADPSGVTDSAAAFQAAIDYAVANVKGVFIPSSDVSTVYRIETPLVIDGPIDFIGESMNGVTITGVGIGAGNYLLSITDPTKITGMKVGNFTLMGDGACNCLYINNVTASTFENINVRTAVNGVDFASTAGNTYQMTWSNLNTLTAISGSAVRVLSGGSVVHTTFQNCFFGGNTGFYTSSGSGLNSTTMLSCNFEGNANYGMYIGGGVQGLSMVGCRTEGILNLIADFMFDPQAGAACNGISITGGYFSRGNAASAIRFNGSSNGFLVSGNFTRQSYTQLVFCNGTGDSGTICGNYQESTNNTYPSVGNPINTNRPSVAVFNNQFINTTSSTQTLIGNFNPNPISGVSGVFRSFNGDVSVATNTFATLFDVADSGGLYIVQIWVSGSASTFNAWAVVADSGATASSPVILTQNDGGSGSLFQISGTNVQAKQLTGGSATINWSYIRIF
tara:strand:+ start:2949 stop:4358 length:1410 start_codon:yes stop_codon:yes gene_type:complete